MTAEAMTAETASTETAAEVETPETEPVATYATPPINETVTRPRIRGPPVAPACFTIKTFCLAHHLSEAMYFKERAEGRGPREMRVGRRVLISFESAERWRIEREAATKAAE